MKKRPLSITIIGWLFIALGVITSAATFIPGSGMSSGGAWDIIPALIVRLLAIVCGVYVLYGYNWARWLLVVWVIFHVIISLESGTFVIVVHSVLAIVVIFILVLPSSSAYFIKNGGRITMELIGIDESGRPSRSINKLPATAKEVLKATKEMYFRTGYVPPWIGYLCIERGKCLGTCAFTKPPENNRVEIAYFTFPGNEGRGIATQMARLLIKIALKKDPGITITARTLPEENGSTAILEKIGFRIVAEIMDSEDGKVWEWELINQN